MSCTYPDMPGFIFSTTHIRVLFTCVPTLRALRDIQVALDLGTHTLAHDLTAKRREARNRPAGDPCDFPAYKGFTRNNGTACRCPCRRPMSRAGRGTRSPSVLPSDSTVLCARKHMMPGRHRPPAGRMPSWPSPNPCITTIKSAYMRP